MSQRHVVVKEAHHYMSQSPNEFYSNHKVSYKPLDLPSATALGNDYASAYQSFTTAHSQPESPAPVNRNKFYQFSTPDYLRIAQVNSRHRKRQHISQIDASSNSKTPVTVLSKVSGWLTVDPVTLSRKNAIEKD